MNEFIRWYKKPGVGGEWAKLRMAAISKEVLPATPHLRYVSRLMNDETQMQRPLRHPYFLPIAALLLLITLFMGAALLPERVLMPLDIIVQQWPPWQQPDTAVTVHNPLLTDVIDNIHLNKLFVADQWRQGKLPLWNPHTLNGYPMTFNTQAAPWYPLTLLYVLLPPLTAVDAMIGLQLLLGGLFMLAYLRRLGLRPLPALLGALLFLFNGMMMVWLEWQVIASAVIWLPLQLYFVERLVQRPPASRHWLLDAILGGIAFALPWLGGHWNWTLYGSMTTAVYLIWRLAPHWRQGWTAVRGGLLLLLIGVGLSLIQVVLAFVYLSQGHRQPFSYAESLSLGLKNRAIAALLPDFFGNPIHWNWHGPTNYNETAFYLGILPLLLLALGAVLRWRQTQVRFFTLWGGLTLLWALGTPAYGLLWILPVFNGLWPSRAITAVLFCGAVLAAFGLDALLDDGWNRRKSAWALGGVLLLMLLMLLGYGWYYQPDWAALRGDWLWMSGMLLLALALLWGRWRGWLGARPFALLALLLVTADLYWTMGDYNTVGHAADYYPPTAVGEFLRRDPELGRLTTLPEGVAYPPNSHMADRLQAFSGYEPAILQRWVAYTQAATGQEVIHFDRKLMPVVGLDSPLLDAVNVKYVVTIADWYLDAAAAGSAQELMDEWVALGATAVTQAITMPDAGLHRVDLPLQVAAGAAGEVIVRVKAADGGQEFAIATWDVTQPLADDWASFFFSAFPSEWGRDFLLTTEFVGDGAVAVGASSAGLAYRTAYLPRPQLAFEAGKTRVYLNEGYLPRAYLVFEAEAAANADEALALVVANQERLDGWVALETAEGLPVLGGSGTGTAVVTDYQPNSVSVDVTLDAPGYLVLADTYYPGWQATVDGDPAPVYRANSVVRAVPVPAGAHSVQFTFRPPDFYASAAISLFTLLFCAGGLLYATRKP